MAHYQRVYGKITQSSDKLAAIDSELETYGPRQTARDLTGFSKWHTRAKEYEHIETIMRRWVAAV